MRASLAIASFFLLLSSYCFADCESHNDSNSEINKAIRALIKGDEAPTWALLDGGFDVNTANGCGATLLHIAAIVRDEKIGSKLLALGANPNARNHLNQTPVFLAANWSSNQILELALNAGGDPNALIDKESPYNTPLLIAVLNNNAKGVKLLLAHAADINFTNKNGISAINLAKKEGYPEIARMLEHEILNKQRQPTR